MTASFRGHVDIVRMLTEAKAPVNTQDKVYAAPTTRKCTMQDIVDVYMHAHGSSTQHNCKNEEA